MTVTEKSTSAGMALATAKVSQVAELTFKIWMNIGETRVSVVDRPRQVKVGLAVLLMLWR